SLQLNEGEVLGIAGLVGAGRTELLRLIFGEDKKESGECFLYGERVNIRRCKDAYDLGMAWVTEDRKKEGLILKFDLKTNIALPIQSLVRKGLFVDARKENAMLSSSMIAPTSNKWYICGDDGMLEIQGLSRLKTVRHYNRKRELVQEFNAEGLDTGYEYEVQACMEALESGAIECPQMPHEETIAVMKLMDRLRDDWGLKLVGE
ncbi:MAG: ATP-binding cassette domain-containing protein, partial [Gemmiger sp.]|uniref:ATP-binding cassette domain-containing protein n=1 Tax=Gemmiger sp. TaxID=2049027 RepID=UPI002E775D0D